MTGTGLAYVAPVAVWSIGDVILLGEPFAVVAELAPERERGRYLAAYGVCWGVATTLGPLLATGLVAAGGPALLWLSCAALCGAMSLAQSPLRAAVTRSRIRPMADEFPLFALSEEHRAIREAVRDLCEAKVAPYAAEVDEESRYPEEAAKALQQADFHAPHVPEEYGGAGADALATVLVIEEIARVCMSQQPDPGGQQAGLAAADDQRLGGAEEELPHQAGRR